MGGEPEERVGSAEIDIPAILAAAMTDRGGESPAYWSFNSIVYSTNTSTAIDREEDMYVDGGTISLEESMIPKRDQANPFFFFH